MAACEQLVELFAEQKLGGIYVAGSTGGWPLFTIEERKAIAERVVRAAAGRLPVMVHVGAVSTADALCSPNTRRESARMPFRRSGRSTIPPQPMPCSSTIAGSAPRPASLLRLSSDLVAKVNLAPSEYVERLLAIPRIAGMKITDHDLYPFGLIHSAAGERLQLVQRRR